MLGKLAGGYRLGKRQVQQITGDLFGLAIATGMVCKLERQSAEVLEAPYNEVALDVHDAPTVSIDDTSWRENRRKAQLWVVVTALTTVFTITAKRSAAVAKAVLGSKPEQVVTSDRHSSLQWIDPAWRQICWSHLDRDFQAIIDRGAAGEATGRRLLRLSKRMFRWWHRLGAGSIDRQRFQRIAARLRREVRAALEAGLRCGCVPMAATCFEILKVEKGLWTFACVEGVEPTNNASERALRHAVIWRRPSGGTDSAQGSRFVERMLTVVATCREQKRNVLDYLSSCFDAQLRRQKVPSLLPATRPAIEIAHSHLHHPVIGYLVADLVKAGFDAPFENPLWTVPMAQHHSDRSQGSHAPGSARVAVFVLPPPGGTTLVPIPRAGARAQGLLQGLGVRETLVRGLGQTS